MSTVSAPPHPRTLPRPPRARSRVQAIAVLVPALLGLVLSGPAPPAVAGPTWVWPVPAPHPVVRAFSVGPQPWSPGHRGVDLAAPPGTTVVAAGAGVVSWAGPLVDRDVVVVVHGALRTTYEPVTPVVSVGDLVLPGEPLGVLDPGHSGCPTSACLHWGLLRGTTYLDPLRLLGLGDVRLLPRSPAGPLDAAPVDAESRPTGPPAPEPAPAGGASPGGIGAGGGTGVNDAGVNDAERQDPAGDPPAPRGSAPPSAPAARPRAGRAAQTPRRPGASSSESTRPGQWPGPPISRTTGGLALAAVGALTVRLGRKRGWSWGR